MDKPIRLKAEEFEALLFEIYKKGFLIGFYTKTKDIVNESFERHLKEQFDELMFKMKLKTIKP